MWRSACPCLRPPAPTCSLAKHSRPMSATNIYTLLSVRIPGRACILYPHLPHRFHRHGQTSRPMLASDDSGAISLLCLYLRPTISHTFVCSMARPSKPKLRPSRTCWRRRCLGTMTSTSACGHLWSAGGNSRHSSQRQRWGHGCGGSARCRGGTSLNMKCIMLEATQGAAAKGVSPPLILFSNIPSHPFSSHPLLPLSRPTSSDCLPLQFPSPCPHSSPPCFPAAVHGERGREPRL